MFHKVTIYVDHLEDSREFDQVQEFLARWKTQITVADYSTGGWEHIWDLLVPEDALAEIPQYWLCASEWSGYQ
jgi:hypothetical protein